jgi:hypothetical protein
VPPFEFTGDTSDLVKFVDHNERRHQTEAQRFLKQYSFLGTYNQEKPDLKQHVLTAEESLNDVNGSMETQFNYTHSKPTVVAHTEDLILIGTSLGEVWMYDAESQQQFCSFTEKGRDFSGNPVTAIAAHPVKSDYILVGYNGG